MLVLRGPADYTTHGNFPLPCPPPLMLERLVSSDLTFLNFSSELQRSSTDEGGTCKNGEKKEEIGAI